jgi:hypothetical protein
VVILSTGFYNYFKDISVNDSEKGGFMLGQFLEPLKASNMGRDDAQSEMGVTLVPALKRLFTRISSRLRPGHSSVAYNVVHGASETHEDAEDLPSDKEGK